MMLKTYDQSDVQGKQVLLRSDLNIPEGLSDHHYRFARAIPEMLELLELGVSKLVIVSHIGRPKGKESALSTKKFLAPLEKALGETVTFAESIEKASKMDGRIILLENIRFESGEKKNARSLAKRLAGLADVYVNDAFGVCHRKHASVHRIAKLLPAFSGGLLKEEVAELSETLRKPMVLAVGGMKMTTKLPLMQHLGGKSKFILLGSGIVHVYRALKLGSAYSGFSVKRSETLALQTLIRLHEQKLIFPADLRVHDRQGEQKVIIRKFDHLQPDDEIIDIGPETEITFAKAMTKAQSIIWNGPVGIVEREEGQEGTLSIADSISHTEAHSIIGGGDTVDFVLKATEGKFSFISTGGGAMLAFLAGSRMPGIDVLLK